MGLWGIPVGMWWLNPRLFTMAAGDGWWLACYARFWIQEHRIPTHVLGLFSLEGWSYHHPAWLYGLWSFVWLTLGGPRVWVWMDAWIPPVLAALAVHRIFQKDGLSLSFQMGIIGWLGMLSWASQPQRGQIWALVLFLWLLVGIRDILESQTFPSYVRWNIPLIVWLWTGVHGGFLLPLGIIGVAWVFRPSRPFFWTIVGAVLVTLIHPYAPQNWIDHILIARNPPDFVLEWLSVWKIVQAVNIESQEPLWLIVGVVFLPFVLTLLPLAWIQNPSRWDLFMICFAFLFTLGGVFHVRQLLWAVQIGGLLWGRVLTRWQRPSFRQVWVGVHTALSLLGFMIRLPALVHQGVAGWEVSPQMQKVIQTLPSGRAFATLQVANTLCWLNPSLSQWMYGTFQLGIARDQKEWDRITQEVILPWLLLPEKGGDSALTFLKNHRVSWVFLHRKRDRPLLQTLQRVRCTKEYFQGSVFTLWDFRRCLAETPAGSPPQ